MTTTDKVQIAFRVPTAIADRARAAYIATRATTRHRTFSHWVAAAVTTATEALEREHHGGQPWASAPADTPSRGRRKGSPATAGGDVVTLGPYLPRADVERARAAFEWTRDLTGRASWAEHLAAALLAATEALEREHHDGQPWPPDLGGDIAPGRPLGSR